MPRPVARASSCSCGEDGNDHYLWVDNQGRLRISPSDPGEVSQAGTVVGSADMKMPRERGSSEGLQRGPEQAAADRHDRQRAGVVHGRGEAALAAVPPARPGRRPRGARPR